LYGGSAKTRPTEASGSWARISMQLPGRMVSRGRAFATVLLNLVSFCNVASSAEKLTIFNSELAGKGFHFQQIALAFGGEAIICYNISRKR
jgi:hypothetical protein